MPAGSVRVLVIHRRPELAAARAASIAGLGFTATAYPVLGPSAFRQIRSAPPDAILIDLTEMPSYGRTMGVLIRDQKALRSIPMVFLEGDPAKSERVREVLPGVEIVPHTRIAAAIRRAIRQMPAEAPAPIHPRLPVAQKLRIRESSRVALLHAPPAIGDILRPLPKNVRLQKSIGDSPVVLFFARSAALLARALPELAASAQPGRTLWICWPKRTSATPCDLTLPGIREMAQPYNLVDNKICSLDATWSATTLTRRRSGSRHSG